MREPDDPIRTWREEHARRVLNVDFKPAPGTRFRARLKTIFEPLRMTRVTLSPCRVIRDAALVKDGDDSVAVVIAQARLTPRYIQHLFESEGVTFSEFVLGQRLARAHRLLTDPRHSGSTISAIAFAPGFGDLSHFNRTFRRRYGATPSEIRAEMQHRDNA